jgi:hypothetical protein
MARYSSFLGRRVEVQYRASDTLLPASGVFVADSGRSIFLEQIFEQRGQHRHFRWEIPYQFLVKIGLYKEDDSPQSTGTTGVLRSPALDAAPAAEASAPMIPEQKRASSAAAGLGLVSGVLPIGHRSKPA